MTLEYKAGLTMLGLHITYKHFLVMKLALKIKIHLKLGVNSRISGWEEWKAIQPSLQEAFPPYPSVCLFFSF